MDMRPEEPQPSGHHLEFRNRPSSEEVEPGSILVASWEAGISCAKARYVFVDFP